MGLRLAPLCSPSKLPPTSWTAVPIRASIPALHIISEIGRLRAPILLRSAPSGSAVAMIVTILLVATVCAVAGAVLWWMSQE